MHPFSPVPIHYIMTSIHYTSINKYSQVESIVHIDSERSATEKGFSFGPRFVDLNALNFTEKWSFFTRQVFSYKVIWQVLKAFVAINLLNFAFYILDL